jgi:hypothetical protein
MILRSESNRSDILLPLLATMSSIEKINAPENPQFTHILSHATKVSGLIFLSGSTPQGKDGKVVEGGIKVVQLLFYRRRLC